MSLLCLLCTTLAWFTPSSFVISFLRKRATRNGFEIHCLRWFYYSWRLTTEPDSKFLKTFHSSRSPLPSMSQDQSWVLAAYCVNRVSLRHLNMQHFWDAFFFLYYAQFEKKVRWKGNFHYDIFKDITVLYISLLEKKIKANELQKWERKETNESK